jgi:hypothetical protein
VWLCVCAASAVGSPIANIRTIGIVHIVLMCMYNLTNACINLKSESVTELRIQTALVGLVWGRTG